MELKLHSVSEKNVTLSVLVITCYNISYNL